ncbi:MAG TPA: hypothetical protein VN325_45515 [Steroidobacteraceae bacterium]|nr:hypothetical protein [Steroidobacteraceae bacterium]
MHYHPGLSARALLTANLLAVISCGGGSGGASGGGAGGPPSPSVTGNGPAPSSGPGDANGYFPVGAQDQWVLDTITDDPKAPAPYGTATVTVTGTKTIQGANATVYTRSDSVNPAGNYDQYFAVGNGGVTALGNTDPGDSISPLLIPYVQLLFPVSVGQVSQVVGQNLPFGHDSNNNPITLDLTQTISNAAMETVDVPAGTFANALMQETTINATAHDGTQSVPVTGSDTAWYAAGVGQVRDQSTASGGGTTIDSVGELRRYLINGRWHGIGATTVIDSSLVTTNCNGTSYPAPSVASDGTNFLIVAYSCSAAGGMAMSNWAGVLVGPDGTMIKTVNITPPAAPAGVQSYLHSVSGFDGTHYLVVYENPTASFSTTTLQSVVLGTDGSMVAGPTMVGTQLLPAGGAPTDNEALGFDGSRFLLVYTDGAAQQMSGVFLTPGTGQPDGSAFAISQGAFPAIAFDGTNFLVAWIDSATSPVGLHARRVSPAGALVDAAQLVLVDLSTATLNEGCCDLEQDIAFDGTNYLVAYRDPRSVTGISGLNYASISAARVSTAGLLLDGTPTTPGIVVAASKSTPRGRVRTVFTGGTYWLVWESSNPQDQLSATRVTTSGTAASAWTDGFTIAPMQTQSYTRIPVLAAGSSGSLLTWVEVDTNTRQTQLMGLRIYPTSP